MEIKIIDKKIEQYCSWLDACCPDDNEKDEIKEILNDYKYLVINQKSFTERFEKILNKLDDVTGDDK